MVLQREEMMAEFQVLLRMVDSLKKKAKMEAETVQSLFHERDVLNKNLLTTDDRTKKEVEEGKIQEVNKQERQRELEEWKARLTKASKYLIQLDKQREKS